MRVNAYKCDNCGKEKGNVNHWYVLAHSADSAQIIKWINTATDASNVSHVCGQECAFAMLTRWIATGKFEREALVPGSFEKKGAA